MKQMKMVKNCLTLKGRSQVSMNNSSCFLEGKMLSVISFLFL